MSRIPPGPFLSSRLPQPRPCRACDSLRSFRARMARRSSAITGRFQQLVRRRDIGELPARARVPGGRSGASPRAWYSRSFGPAGPVGGGRPRPCAPACTSAAARVEVRCRSASSARPRPAELTRRPGPRARSPSVPTITTSKIGRVVELRCAQLAHGHDGQVFGAGQPGRRRQHLGGGRADGGDGAFERVLAEQVARGDPQEFALLPGRTRVVPGCRSASSGSRWSRLGQHLQGRRDRRSIELRPATGWRPCRPPVGLRPGGAARPFGRTGSTAGRSSNRSRAQRGQHRGRPSAQPGRGMPVRP